MTAKRFQVPKRSLDETLRASVVIVILSSIDQSTSKDMRDLVINPALAMGLIPDTGEKPFTCVICGMSFVRNDLMLRHGRLKHKMNLKKPPQPRAQTESVPTASPSPDVPTHLAPAPREPEHMESSTMDLDALFSAIDPALDPSLYAPWPMPSISQNSPGLMDLLPAVMIPNTHQLLMNNSFRDVLVSASQAMSRPPKVPSLSSLNRYVSLFMEKFLPHHPFIPPTFNTETANPLLLTAMASIGALFGVERKTALMLHSVSKHLEENLRVILGHEDYPIWAIQALYLNSVPNRLIMPNVVFRCLERIREGRTIRCESYANSCHGIFRRCCISRTDEQGHPQASHIIYNFTAGPARMD